jgi:hypothetical protein
MRRCEKIKNLCERCQQVTPLDGLGAAGSGGRAIGQPTHRVTEYGGECPLLAQSAHCHTNFERPNISDMEAGR